MNERDNRIDILKGIAIYLVVIGHIIAWYFKDFSLNISNMPYNSIILWKTIYSFHMPLFIFLSGYVFMNPRKTYTLSHMIKRFSSYLIPFISMGILLHLWRGGAIDNYWYFRTLIILSLILYFVQKIISKHPIIIFIVFISIITILYSLIPYNTIYDIVLDKNHLNLGYYFGLGYLFRIYRDQLITLVINQYSLLASFLFVLFCIIYNYNISYIRPILTIVLLLNICDILSDLGLCNHLSKIGKHTMDIYILHFFFTIKLFDVGDFILHVSSQISKIPTNFILQSILSIPVSILIVKVCILIGQVLKAKELIALLFLGDMRIFSKKAST